MSRWMMMLVLVLLSGCGIDPCSIDAGSPTCAVKQSESQATISAINSDQAMRAAKATIAIQATVQAMRADATRAAIVQQATKQVVDGEATKIALDVSGAIEGARAKSAALPYETVFQIVVFWLLLPAAAVVAVLYAGRHATMAVSNSMHKRAAMITYGPANNPQIAFVTFDPATHQPIKFITAEGLVGNYLDLISGRGVVETLEVPEQMKLAALVEATKRVQAARIASATGLAPWGGRAPAYTMLESAAPEAASGATQPAGFAVPALADLLKQWTPSRDQLLLGYGNDGTPRYCNLEDLLSTGVIGRPRTGKSTVLRFIYLQCRLIGARVVIWDLHLTIVGDIPGAEAFTELEDINQSADEMCAILERRIKARDYNAQPIMVLADEFNLLAPNSPEVTAAMGRIILEGRKVKMFSMISGQGLPAKLFGDSTPRDALSSRFVLHTTTRQANMIGLDRDAQPWVVDLKPGYAIVDGPIDPQVLAIPNTTEADIRAFLPGSDSFRNPVSPVIAGSWEPAGVFDGTGSGTGTEPALELDAELAQHADQIRALLRAKTPVKDIIRQIWGEAAATGNAYKVYSGKLRSVISTLV